jgi:hypothetical protein
VLVSARCTKHSGDHECSLDGKPSLVFEEARLIAQATVTIVTVNISIATIATLTIATDTISIVKSSSGVCDPGEGRRGNHCVSASIIVE